MLEVEFNHSTSFTQWASIIRCVRLKIEMLQFLHCCSKFNAHKKTQSILKESISKEAILKNRSLEIGKNLNKSINFKQQQSQTIIWVRKKSSNYFGCQSIVRAITIVFTLPRSKDTEMCLRFVVLFDINNDIANDIMVPIRMLNVAPNARKKKMYW